MTTKPFTEAELRRMITDWKVRGGNIDEIITLIRQYVNGVIGEDDSYNLNSKMTSHYNAKRKGANQLRAEQRKRAGIKEKI